MDNVDNNIKEKNLLIGIENFNGNSNKETAELYLEKEKNYLETIYFQILRNSREDNFNKNSLILFFSFSEYLNSKIFDALSKRKLNLKLDEFISGINLLFSRFYPNDEELLVKTIFKIIAEDLETITYQSIRDFLTNLLFDTLCKAQIYKIEIFYSISKNLNNLIRKTFSIGKINSKISKFTENDFLKIIVVNPELLNSILILLNFLSPINEKLIFTFLQQDNVEIFNNDDFEEEILLEEERTPRINTLSNEKIIKLKSFKNDERVNCSFKIDKNYLKKEFNQQSLLVNSDNSITLNEKLNKSSIEITEKLNLDFKPSNKLINKNNYYNMQNLNNNLSEISNENKKFFEKNQNYLSTDILFDVSINKKNHDENFIDSIHKNENSDINIMSDKNILINSQKRTHFSKETSEKQLWKLSADLSSSRSNLKDINEIASKSKILQFKKNSKKFSKYKIEKNASICQKDLNILKSLGKDTQLFKYFEYLYKEFKIEKESNVQYKKFYVLFRKINRIENRNKFVENYINENINFNQTEENFFAFKLTLMLNELIIYNSPLEKNDKSNNKKSCNNSLEEYLISKQTKNIKENKFLIYFYNLKNLIFPISPLEENLEYYFTFGDKKYKYYGLTFLHINQSYQLFFNTYENLDRFFKLISSKLNKISRLFFLNTKKLYYNELIQRVSVFRNIQERFCLFHELIDDKLQKSMKFQTFDKKYLNTQNLLFFRRLFDICKLNNFLNVSIIPISNFYENHRYIILEYTIDDFRIIYDQGIKNFIILLSDLDLLYFLKQEVNKFAKIAKMLNKSEDVSIIFELLEYQKLLIYSKLKY